MRNQGVNNYVTDDYSGEEDEVTAFVTQLFCWSVLNYPGGITWTI